MRTVSTLFRSTVLAGLVLAIASVTAAAAVGANGNDTPPEQVANPAPGVPPAPPATATPDRPATEADATATAPGQDHKAPKPTSPAATAPGRAKNARGRATGRRRAAAAKPIPAVAAPVLGRSMAVARAAGHVHVRLPGSSGYAPLNDAGSVPPGTVVDARRGTLTLRTAVDAAGHVQTATVRGAVFELRQAVDGRGFTEFVLRGGPAGPCGGSSARAAAVAGRTAKPGALWVRDRHGRFRTRGRNSVATVRGTRWSTQETCAGTVTRVMQGAVDVHDLRSGRTVTVRGGRAYVARSRG